MTDRPISELERRIDELEKQALRYAQTEAALLESKQVIEGILHAIPARVFWKDRDLIYLGCNRSFARDAGFAYPDDVVGKDDYQLVWRDQADLYRADDRRVIETGVARMLIEEPQATPEGTTITLLTSKVPLRDAQGAVRGVLGTYLDITDRKRTEAALAEEQKRLRHALDDVQTLRGIVPICALCKKVRDDQGYWGQVEKYIAEHSEATLTHGICPQCSKTLYGELADDE